MPWHHAMEASKYWVSWDAIKTFTLLIFQGVKRYLNSEVLRLVKDDIWSSWCLWGTKLYPHRKRENVHLSCWKVNSWLGGETSMFVYFHPKTLGKWSDLTFVFQMGWFNNQCVDKVPWKFACCCCTWYIPWIYPPPMRNPPPGWLQFLNRESL